tara:strand:+ start:590 stop:784 length:195 start_codon:yes stop_codon:yes gene_type:complete
LIKIQDVKDGKGQAAYENINENVKIKIVGDAFQTKESQRSVIKLNNSDAKNDARNNHMFYAMAS